MLLFDFIHIFLNFPSKYKGLHSIDWVNMEDHRLLKD